MRFKSGLILLLVFFSVAEVGAATVVELVNRGETEQVMTDGKTARFGVGDQDYVLMDVQTGEMTMVDLANRQVQRLKMPDSHAAVKSDIDIRLSADGAGKTIAGYPTRRYRWQANGQSCGVIYASRDALAVEGVKTLFAGVQKMVKQQAASMGGYLKMMDVCTRGQLYIGESVNELGMPMRVENRDGSVASEVKAIRTDVRLPTSTFATPEASAVKDFDTHQMADRLSDRQAQMQQNHDKIMQDMPAGLRSQMQQLQQSGQLPPEAMRQLQQMQRMLQQ